MLDHTAAYRGLSASVMLATRDEGTEMSASMKAVHAAGAALFARAQQAGAVRADLDIAAVFQLVCAIGVATEQPPDGAGQADRILSVVIDGLRSKQPTSSYGFGRVVAQMLDRPVRLSFGFGTPCVLARFLGAMLVGIVWSIRMGARDREPTRHRCRRS